MNILEQYAFSASDYVGLKFNPFGVRKGESVLKAYPVLSRIKSLDAVSRSKDYDGNAVLRYIMLAYDPSSPAVTMIHDEFKRKSFCGATAGFEWNPDTGAFTDTYYKIMNCDVDDVNAAILDFLFLFNNPSYTLFMSVYESYYKKLKVMNEEVKDDTKNSLELEKIRGVVAKDASLMEKQLNELAEKILREKNIYLKNDLYRVSYDELVQRLNLTPESRAKMREEKTT